MHLPTFGRDLSRPVVGVARLAPWEWRVLFDTLRFALLVELKVRRGSLDDLLAWSEGASSHASKGRADPGPWSSLRVERVSRLAERGFDALPLPSTCLRRSLVLAALLTRRGVPARVGVGVDKRGNGIHAHAWVESNGRVIGGDVPSRFVPLRSDMREGLSQPVRWSP
jgi:hypothetical protein